MTIEVDKNSLSKIKISNLYISHFNFARLDNIDDMSIKMLFKREIISDGENSFIVSLQCNLIDDNDKFSLEIEVKSLFELDESVEASMHKPLLEDNATAIMFPFLRSQITLLTSQPGMDPIVLPIMNISNLFKESEKNQY